MKLMVIVFGMLVGLVIGACDVGDFDAVNQGPGPLPGDCNNPVVCGTTGGKGGGGGGTPGGGGGGQQMCMNCDCEPSPSTCNHCVQRCSTDKFTCDVNGGEACKEIYDACRRDCGEEGQTCVCPH